MEIILFKFWTINYDELLVLLAVYAHNYNKVFSIIKWCLSMKLEYLTYR